MVIESKVKFSLTWKILVSVVILLVCAISANLYFSYNLFTEDKSAYIYEAGLDKSENLSNKLTSKIKQTIQTSEFLHMISNIRPASVEKVLSKIDDILLFASFKNKHQFKQNIVYGKRNSITPQSTAIKALKKLTYAVISNKRISIGKNIYFAPLFHLIKYPAIAIFTVLPNSSQETVTIIDISDLDKEIKEDNIFKNHILTKNGTSILSKSEPSYSLSLRKGNINKGTKLLTNAEAGTESLVSFVKDPQLHLIFISEVSKAEAFNITKLLLQKSVIFGLTLLSVFVFFGTLFSAKLTTPIKSLVEATKQISIGNYSFKLNINSWDEFKLLAHSFTSMSGKIESLLNEKEIMIEKLTKAKAELEDYSKNLEKKVDERTFELKTSNNFLEAMINSLDQGLVVFDRDSNCNDIYTKATEGMFQTCPKGRKFPDVIGLSPGKETENFKKWSEIIFSEQIPFSSAVGLGVKEKIYGTNSNDEDFRSIAINYYPMRNEDESISNIVAVSTDKTAEVLAQEKAIATAAYSKMVLSITKNRKQFITFLKEVTNILEELNDVYSLEGQQLDINKALILFHSLNGGFAMYSVLSLQERARSIETNLVNLKQEDNPQIVNDYIPAFMEEVNTYTSLFLQFIEECKIILGNDFLEREKRVELSLEDAKMLLNAIEKTEDQTLISLGRDLIERESIVENFRAFEGLISSLAIKLNKKIHPFKYINPSLRINPRPYSDFFNSLIHLFRNCMDHGIELAHTREKLGKDASGEISISFEENEEMLTITIQDDGGGIDPSKVRSKLKELDSKQTYDSIPDDEIIYKIFDPTFSTAKELTAISGRGVGMSAVRDSVEKINGQIIVHSKINEGTIFQFNLPRIS